MDQFQNLLNTENIFKSFSASIMSTVFINSNINPNMNGTPSTNRTLPKIEEKNESKSQVSLITQVTGPKWEFFKGCWRRIALMTKNVCHRHPKMSPTS